MNREAYQDAREEVEGAAEEEAHMEEEMLLVRNVYKGAIRTVKGIE